jgi:hypothetical protein
MPVRFIATKPPSFQAALVKSVMHVTDDREWTENSNRSRNELEDGGRRLRNKTSSLSGPGSSNLGKMMEKVGKVICGQKSESNGLGATNAARSV